MRDDAVAEKRGNAQAGPVEELVGDEEFERAQRFLQGAHGADRDDALDAQHLHGVDIGAIVDFSGQQAMAAAVAREEGDAAAFERAENEGVGGIAERRMQADFARLAGPAWSRGRCRR